MSRRYEVVVIGGGQAGLAMGYQLAQRGVDFMILDAANCVGSAWRERWESLTLFTPAGYSALPGLPFPAEPDHLPRKDEVADYLAQYAALFSLPIRHSERVINIRQLSEWNGFLVTTTTSVYRADQVVVATGAFHTPSIPKVANMLSPRVRQLHSSAYRTPAQLPEHGTVLVVGGGNSGMQIATEVSETRSTSLAIGTRLPRLHERVLGRSIFWWLETTGLMDAPVDSFMGSRFRKREFLIGRGAADLARDAKVRVVQRVVAAEGEVVFTADGTAIDVAAVIWATGFAQDFSWIDAPVLDAGQHPQHVRGTTSVRGLYFLGLPWQHTRGSSLLGWVGRDAAFLARHMAS